MKIEKSILILVILISFIRVPAIADDENISPLNAVFKITTYSSRSLFVVIDDIHYFLLASESDDSDGPSMNRAVQIYRQRETAKEGSDARNTAEIKRADLLCRAFGFKVSTKDVTQDNTSNLVLYDIDGNKPYKPKTCFQASDKLAAESSEFHFPWTHEPIEAFEAVVKASNGNDCWDKLVEAAVTGGYAVDGSGMTPDQYDAAKKAAEAKTGYPPGKILRSSYFTSLTCSNQDISH